MMPQSAKVIIHYGPYEACGLAHHRGARLEGLRTVLSRDNHTVEEVEVSDRNVVQLWVNGELVFDCDIRDLDYGGDGDLDELCLKALEAVRKAF